MGRSARPRLCIRTCLVYSDRSVRRRPYDISIFCRTSSSTSWHHRICEARRFLHGFTAAPNDTNSVRSCRPKRDSTGSLKRPNRACSHLVHFRSRINSPRFQHHPHIIDPLVIRTPQHLLETTHHPHSSPTNASRLPTLPGRFPNNTCPHLRHHRLLQASVRCASQAGQNILPRRSYRCIQLVSARHV